MARKSKFSPEVKERAVCSGLVILRHPSARGQASRGLQLLLGRRAIPSSARAISICSSDRT